ncbi:MAG: molybdopterin-dependent oxidoreductase [bacterium JZ-2024 1]
MVERNGKVMGDRAEGRIAGTGVEISRREFLRTAGVTGLAALLIHADWGALLQPIPEIENPLSYYPNRDWEKLYRDLSRYDRTFVFQCAPNDTHNCLLRAYVKNNVVVRIGPTYGYGKAADLYGNRASSRWDPRCCQKGLAMGRRIHGDRRVKGAFMRKGWKEWADAGFPRGPDGKPDPRYMQRGKEDWLRVSWDEAFRYIALGYINLAETYKGEEGAERLRAQGYDPEMVEAMHGAATQTFKFRGGMPLLGATRVFGLYRMANMMALLDALSRGVDSDHAYGGRGWDNYSWHTDLPPGHTMVTGQQTIDFDLAEAEYADLIVCFGMNWISTKMPDGHWLTEARIRGTKVVTVACEYQSTSSKADEVIVTRPGTDSALALGLAYVMIQENLYDAEFLKQFTDLPLLVRMDTLSTLRADEIIPNYQLAPLSNFITLLKPGEAPPPPIQHAGQVVSESLRKEWGDFVVWNEATGSPIAISRDDVGENLNKKGVKPVLDGEFEVRLVDGKSVKCRTVFSLIKQYILDNFDPRTVSQITWAPESAVKSLARLIAANKGKTLLVVGMGPNHFFNNDLKDRALFLVAAMTGNIGRHGGNIGSYAGNYRGAYFNGMPQFVQEDPFSPELDPAKPAKAKYLYKMESAHYYNYGDRPLKVGNKMFTGKTHMPTPTKALWFANSNSLLGNAKWHHDVVNNTIPRIEMIVVNDWWWTASCEYADFVLGVDSWAELKYPDMMASVTNPFLTVWPRTTLPRIHDTRSDVETYAGVAKALADLTGERRFVDYWKFAYEGRMEVYLQRILNASTTGRGYQFAELETKAAEGIPALLMTRTYPKIMGWEQTNESKPWYTRSGRLEFYRPEPEFIEYGENLPVHREPIDGTPHEPNVIVAKPHPAIRPKQPEDYGISRDNQSSEVRQVRNVVLTPEQLLASQHPLRRKGHTHVYITPKYRHGAHTTPVDLDLMAVWFGPFGDLYRRDQRMPWVGEGYVDLNPEDAKALGIEDGDYVWVDGDPEDRPFRGWDKAGRERDYRVARALMRARYYPGIPRGIARSWFHMYVATYGSVEGHETRGDRLARNPRTNYQAMFRYGSHQSATRAWLKPTLMTDSLTRKNYFGQVIGKGFEADVNCTVGAPKESFVKITRAEDGGMNGERLWRPAAMGFRPTYESEEFRKYLAGEFFEIE